jgi:hypothetical protein
MGTPTLLRLTAESLSNLASKHASEKIRLLIKRQVTVSKRQRSWFSLNLQERSIIDLALSLKVRFRSPELVTAVVSIMKRLQQLGNRTFREQLFRGTKLAWSFSEAAVSWGNVAAKNWRSDVAYIAFLGRFSRST